MWMDYASKQPPAAGVYEWRVPSRTCKGLVVRVLAHHRTRGAGYRNVLSPVFDHWDGYNVTVPAGTQWRAAPEGTSLQTYEQRLVCAEDVEFCACPYCRQVPRLHGVERASGGGLIVGSDAHRFNSWWLECCAWARTPRYDDPRELASARASLLAKGAS